MPVLPRRRHEGSEPVEEPLHAEPTHDTPADPLGNATHSSRFRSWLS